MKGKFIYKILDLIEDTSLDMADFTIAFLKAGYGASMGKIDREYEAIKRKRENRTIARDRKRRLQIYLSKLKNQGLISKDSSNKIILSAEGREKLSLLRKNRIINKNYYRKESGDKMIIISYDIPVTFNKERAVLRSILDRLGFSMVHKSVWIGKVKLPKEFILALNQLSILDFVEIMEVTKNGSLKSIQ